MRRRFFLIVLIFLMASILVVSTLQLFFFENERVRLLDQRLEAIASTLIASGLSLDLIDNLESTDDLIHDLLGEERVDQIINIYSLSGDILAQNYTGTVLPLEFAPQEHRQTYVVKGRTVRVLNIQSGQLLVQVGTIFTPSLNRWNFLNSRFVLFIVGIFLLLVVVAYFSSGVLFRPLRTLTKEFQSMSVQLDEKLGQPLTEFVVGSELARLAHSYGTVKTKDEFELLCMEIRNFLKKLEDYTKSFHAQTSILTHELKTPLTVLRNFLSEIKSSPNTQASHLLIEEALREIESMTGLINHYLQWCVLASNPNRPQEIYALHLSDVVKKIVKDLNSVYHDRIRLESQGDTTVFALPEHLYQLLSNLLSNALHYSPQDQEVILKMDNNKVQIEDFGPGIPEDVLKYLGRPFNRGAASSSYRKSSGLGLAWAYSLCEKYHWKLDIQSSSQGTSVTVQFA